MVLAACGKSSSSTSNLTPRFAVNGVTNVRAVADKRDELAARFLPWIAGTPRVLTVSQSGLGSNISSLQFFITRIQLCQDLTISGSGYSAQVGCTTVYTAGNGDNAYDTFKIADAQADTSDNWVDLMSNTSINNFSTKGSNAAAGTYRYGIIENRKPIKLNAQFATTNLGTIRTCTGGTVSSTGSGLDTTELSTVADMTTCTRATTAIGTNGGGKWFKFQNPVTITTGSSYVLDLGYNADNAIVAGPTGLNGLAGVPSYLDGTRSMMVPQLAISPVLRTTAQKTVREQYEISGITGLPGTVLLDLYYAGAKADVGTGAIAGAQTMVVYSASGTSSGYSIGSPYAVTTTRGTVAISDWASNAIVSGLVRSTTATVGGTQTVTVNKATMSGAGVGSGTVTTATATFMGVVEL